MWQKPPPAWACGWLGADPWGLLPGADTAVVAVAPLSELCVLLEESSSAESPVPFPIAEIH